MARKVANVDIITDSFEIWLLETNELLHALSTEIITANTTYANTGNSTINRTAQLWGTFGANNLVVTDWVRGGNVTGQYANLNISTNTIVSNNSYSNLQIKVANSTTFSYITPNGGYFGNTTANSFINATAIITQSNTSVNTNISPVLIQVANSTSTANMTATSFKTGIFQANTIEMQVGANVIANSISYSVGNSTSKVIVTNNDITSIANLTVTTNKTTFTSGADTLVSVANATSSANISTIAFTTGIFTGNTTTMSVGANVVANATGYSVGNSTVKVTVTSSDISSLANLTVTTTKTTFSNVVNVTGNTILSNTLYVTGASVLSNTLSVTGNTTLSNTLTVTGNTALNNPVTVMSEYTIDVNSNTNLGTNTTSPRLIYSFPKASFSSGKITVQVKNSGNTQISEMVLAHNGTDAYITVFGTVASPPASNGSVSPLGTFIANVNASNVELLLNQTRASSAVKVVAQLIK